MNHVLNPESPTHESPKNTINVSHIQWNQVNKLLIHSIPFTGKGNHFGNGFASKARRP